jgi:mannose-1-phosphate guanylyltransferase/mannose-6-phosphate isomerase
MNRPKIIERPWGRYKEYARNEPCTVWVVEMKPGETGSLQSHEKFDELWVMLSDGATVQVGDQIFNPRKGDEFFIPRGTKHRFSNNGQNNISMFEIAYGTVSDEDKTRFEDKYNRK